MEIAVVADEVLGADGRFGIYCVRAEVLDGERYVRAVRIDYAAAESAERFLLVVHSGDGACAIGQNRSPGYQLGMPVTCFRGIPDMHDPLNHAFSAWLHGSDGPAWIRTRLQIDTSLLLWVDRWGHATLTDGRI